MNRDLCFNSIKVRLKPSSRQGWGGNRLFQFHKGTIKTRPPSGLPLTITGFNSIKVRLKPVKSKTYIPEDSISLRVQKYKKYFK